jgi:hypothetical protein
MKKYAWRQLNQWESADPKFYVEYRDINTGMSKSICTFLLVEEIDTGGGYIRAQPINKDDVTPEMLEIAKGVRF